MENLDNEVIFVIRKNISFSNAFLLALLWNFTMQLLSYKYFRNIIFSKTYFILTGVISTIHLCDSINRYDLNDGKYYIYSKQDWNQFCFNRKLERYSKRSFTPLSVDTLGENGLCRILLINFVKFNTESTIESNIENSWK